MKIVNTNDGLRGSIRSGFFLRLKYRGGDFTEPNLKLCVFSLLTLKFAELNGLTINS